jgi:hypothetical protein
MTINEALVWMKTLRERHTELVSLRNENSRTVTRYRGLGGDKEDKIEPTYDVRTLDRQVTRLALEIRKLDLQIKATNAVTQVVGYTPDDNVLGEL